MKTQFKATFKGGVTSRNHDTATFFMLMEDKKASAEEIQGYIDIGRMVDPCKDWNDIQRVLDSLPKGKAKP